MISSFSATVAREKDRADGANGSGKTTLLKSLIANAPEFVGEAEKAFAIDGGEVGWGHEVRVGYFPQDFGDSIDKSSVMTAVDWLWQFDPQSSHEELRGLLGRMLFSGEDALKPTKALSGGETARLIFSG